MRLAIAAHVQTTKQQQQTKHIRTYLSLYLYIHVFIYKRIHITYNILCVYKERGRLTVQDKSQTAVVYKNKKEMNVFCLFVFCFFIFFFSRSEGGIYNSIYIHIYVYMYMNRNKMRKEGKKKENNQKCLNDRSSQFFCLCLCVVRQFRVVLFLSVLAGLSSVMARHYGREGEGLARGRGSHPIFPSEYIHTHNNTMHNRVELVWPCQPVYNFTTRHHF